MSNLQSPTKLTEFAPLQPEEKKEGVSQFISKFFKLGRSAPEPTPAVPEPITDNTSQDALPTWAIENTEATGSKKEGASNVYEVNPADGRNHINVLKRISNLLALKSNNLQDYADTELKQYWMPDSVSKECYECSEKFTTFRRRHHCRVCGQIFCSQCCNQQIPGKIFGCTGDLRVCTYCCKVVLTYLQSSDLSADLSEDLKALQESLQSKYGSGANLNISQGLSPAASIDSIESNLAARRKISLGYQEGNVALNRKTSSSYLSNEEKVKALQNSTSLRNLHEEIFRANSGIVLQTHRYRLRNYNGCLLGSELVDWLIYQQKANNRVQASAICQALLEGGYIESVTDTIEFLDGFSIYKPGVISSPEPAPNNRMTFDVSHQDEPSWVQEVPQELSTTDSDTEFSPNQDCMRSSSSYTLDLNFGANTVYLSRPPATSQSPIASDSEQELEKHTLDHSESQKVMTTEQTEVAPESGWHHASKLRDENGEAKAYELLTQAYKQHEDSLLKQLLSINGLSLTWSEVVMPLIHDVVDVIRPDMNHDAQEIDIRNHVHFKKVTGNSRNNSKLIRGIVFSKNVAHKGMAVKYENPKILLLQCPIVYQRQEGRLTSLEPVLMQESEYLKNAVARIVALQPNVILVQRTVARVAQDLLRDNKVTLVFNVKKRVLERLSRCTQADLVSSIDSHIGPRPRLGSCKRFFLKTYTTENGASKTLMFFEGLPLPHLGGTVLLKGPSCKELVKVKKVAALFLFAAYNWRLEKSFLMDVFAQPPDSKPEFYDESKENSPANEHSERKLSDSCIAMKNINEVNKNESETKKKSKAKAEHSADNKVVVSDFTDPLHSTSSDYINKNCTEKLSVAELPFSNNFRKALDDTILCISPYLVFSVPFLETEIGRKCKLRKFFPDEIYHSNQFHNNKRMKAIKEVEIIENCDKNQQPTKLNNPHPFVTAQISISIDNNEIQNLLASFRACGGRYPKKDSLVLPIKNAESEGNNEFDKIDVLDPKNHQRISVLFCSSRFDTNVDPSFCVNPWVVRMDFYGLDDIPLGCFLDRYCFRTSYCCQLKTCEASMLKHIRRFVHNSGCISLCLYSWEREFSEDGIVMWTWCLQCSSASPLVPMSTDTWSFSFAKYLELLFHGNIYSRRGNPPCPHNLHHDNLHYFGYKNIVACFKYSPIQIWEISFPPAIIEITYDIQSQQNEIIDDIQMLALKGDEIYQLVLEKLPSDADFLSNLKQLHIKDVAHFKQRIGEVQLKLTSPTLESKEIDCSETPTDHQAAIWRIQDSLVRIKMAIVDAVEVWNARLTEAYKKRDTERKNTKILEQDSPSSENKPILETQISADSNSGNAESLVAKKIRSLDHNDGDDNCPPSPKSHHRSHSEGTVLNEDSSDGKKETDKKSVKTILSHLLPSNTTFTPLTNPFNLQEHYMLPTGAYMPLVVYENEPSSIVAYALNSLFYKDALDDITGKKLQSTEHTPSPVNKRKTHTEKDSKESGETIEKSSLLSFLRNKDSKNELMTSSTNSADSNVTNTEPTAPNDKPEDGKKSKQHITVQFEDGTCNFFCRVFFAEKFTMLRNTVLPIGDEAYIRSLSRCVQWNARGGKSGSAFCKTVDDRFILKEMTSNEVKLFLEWAPNYFNYMQKCYTTLQPTLLGKIVGIYQVIFRNTTSNASLRTYLLVMENLFYKRSVSQKFDLKGSMRNRLVNPDNQDGEIVLLDENLMKMSCNSPLYILPHSKAVLTSAIQNDTEFLSKQFVMDYSLLVGLDSNNKELVLGIIDYIRTFTWDKKIETMVKKSLVIGAQGKLPTIISPEQYQIRFIQAMHRYFLEVPDPWAGLGKNIEY